MDLVSPSSFTSYWGIVVNALEIGEQSKTQEYDDSLLIDSPWIQFLHQVLALLAEGPATERTWNFPYQLFVQELGKACEALRVPKMVPYEMRHSGPSHDRMHRLRSLLQVQKRGRWKTSRSLVRYEKHTRMLQSWNALPLVVRKHAERCQVELEGFMLGRSDPPFLAHPIGTGGAKTGTSRS